VVFFYAVKLLISGYLISEYPFPGIGTHERLFIYASKELQYLPLTVTVRLSLNGIASGDYKFDRDLGILYVVESANNGFRINFFGL